jgi:hypothetical protein
MATTRIKDLSKTATTVNSDANLVLDGNTGGTQKITRDNFRQDTADAFVASPGTYNLAPINSGTGKIDATYLPTSSDTPKGAWNASTNTPTLADGSGTAGDYYDVTVAGSADLGSGSITFTVGDVVKYNGTTWFKIDSVTNILDGVSTIDGAKAAIEIPDVGTAPNEVPLSGQLGSMSFQSAEAISVAKAQIESTTGTGSTQALTVTDGTDNNFVVQEDGKAVSKAEFKSETATNNTEYAANYLRATGGAYYVDNYTVGGSTNFRVSNASAIDTQAVTIDSTGNVTVSSGQMQVAGGAVSAPSYAFSGDLSTGMSRPTANAVNLVAGGSEVVRVTSTGVAIGTGNVTVNGGRLEAKPNSGTNTGSQSELRLYGHESNASRFAAIKCFNTGGTDQNALSFYTSSGGTETQRVRIDEVAGDVEVLTGNVVIGTSGKGIDFGSGASTTIDDWEVGTWTPVFAPSGGSFTALTMNVVAARYVKIGHQVTVNCYIQTTNLDTTGASGQVMVTGLPYGNAGSNNFVSAHIGYAIDWTEAPAGGYVNQSSTQIVLNKRFASITGSLSPMDVNGLNTASGSKNTIMLTATYNSF